MCGRLSASAHNESNWNYYLQTKCNIITIQYSYTVIPYLTMRTILKCFQNYTKLILRNVFRNDNTLAIKYYISLSYFLFCQIVLLKLKKKLGTTMKLCDIFIYKMSNNFILIIISPKHVLICNILLSGT